MRKTVAILLATAALAQDAGVAEPAQNRLDEANKKAAEKVYRTVADAGSPIRNRLRGLKKEDVIVVGGLFDFVQEVLKAYRCPHTVITPAELEHHPLDPAHFKIIFLNCHYMDRNFPRTQEQRPRPTKAAAAARLEEVLRDAGLTKADSPGQAIRQRFFEVMYFADSKYSLNGLKKLGAAIKQGAWVMSTDWAILALEQALPGWGIRWTGHSTYEETIEVRPGLTGKRHSLLKGVFGQPAKARWWLETEAYLFKVKGRHKLLVESRKLAARYHGHKNVVVLLEPGKGRVMHALSHGWLQKGRADDISVMHKLMLNYLTEKSIRNWRRRHADVAAREKQKK